MRVSQYLTCFALATSAINAASIPESNALDTLEEHTASVPRSSDVFSPENTIEKRKGGGGRGGGSSSGGGGRSSGGSSSSGRTSSTSNVGGATRAGSGPARSFGGGGFYGGGAAVPYSAGKKTPKGLIAGALLAPALLLAIMPGIWLWSVYPYHFHNPYRFVNETAQNVTNPNGTNSSLPVICLCQEFSVCGCDENDDTRYLNDLVGNGSYPALNKSLVTVSEINGTTTLVINGSLPNGTTAPGGQDDAGVALAVGKYSGYWVMGLIVVYTVAFM